jgi:hypothetical protein
MSDLPLSAYLGVKTNARQRKMVDLIEREFKAAGYDRPITVAAVTNSYVESRKWDPLEHTWGPEYKRTGKKTEDSAGLFQLNRMGGHGEGMPMGNQYPVGPSSKKGDSRYDPVLNIRRILEVMRRSTDFSIAQYNFGHDAVKMAGEFCKIIEKPANKELKAKEREDLVAKLFPQGWEGPLESPVETTEIAVPGVEDEGMDLTDKLLLFGVFACVGAIGYTAYLRQQHIKSGRPMKPLWGK